MVLLLVLIMSGFVIGGAYSEIETNFVIMGVDGVDDSDFWDLYGGYFVACVVVLVTVAVYLNAIKSSKKKKRK